MELITDLINSVKTTLDSINEAIKKYQKYQPKSSTGFETLCDSMMNSGKNGKNRWERIKIADFRQYLSDRDLINSSPGSPGRYAEVSGKIWFGIEYDFSFIKISGEKFIFYSTYDDHLTIEIHVTADHPIAKILLLK